MSFSFVKIKDCVDKISNWNPITEGSDQVITYIDLSAVHKDIKKITNVVDIEGRSAPSRARQLVKDNDVLVSTVRPNLNGVAKVYSSLDGATASTGFTVLRAKKDILDSSYLFHWVKTSNFINDMVSKATGQSYPAVSDKTVLNSEIPLPPIEEQRRIASILDKADAIRQKRQQAIAKLDEFLQVTFIDMFGDPLENPKKFPIKKLSEFYIDPKNGTKCGPFGSALKREEYTDSGVPVWSMDVLSLKGEFQDQPSLWISEEKYSELETYAVIKGDILISRAGTVGKMGVVHSRFEKSIISTNLIRLRFGRLLLPDYFVSLMTFCKNRLSRLKTGADGAFTHMNTGILDNLEFPYPPIEIQNKYLKIYTNIQKKKKELLKSASQLDELFNALQQKAFNGTL